VLEFLDVQGELTEIKELEMIHSPGGKPLYWDGQICKYSEPKDYPKRVIILNDKEGESVKWHYSFTI